MSLIRRRFLSIIGSVGAGSVLGSTHALTRDDDPVDSGINLNTIRQAEKLAGLEFSREQRELLVSDAKVDVELYKIMRKVPLGNEVPPAFNFEPVLPGMRFDREERPFTWTQEPVGALPGNLEELAFWPVTRLAQLIKSRQISAVDLAEVYLNRLKKHGDKLKCVVTLTEDLAYKQARKADADLAAGTYHGPLHGIPWGIKDLFATKDYPTTWGAAPFKDQLLDYDATVVERLENAGAVLVAKLTSGALAWGDIWFGGKTRNPWDTDEGSSGSSAGPASATAAGLVGFSIGTETYGSIISPATRCGVTGLRPSFGRVSRYGVMTLSWSMDKVGPICRSVEDCALVLQAIGGPDRRDSTLKRIPFNWDCKQNLHTLKVGYLKSAFEKYRNQEISESLEEYEAWKANDLNTLKVLRGMGCTLKAIELPKFPVGVIGFILDTEAAAAFEHITRDDKDDREAVTQLRETVEWLGEERRAWPDAFRHSRLIPAVEYIQANRIRWLLMEDMAKLMSEVDVFVAPTFGENNMLLTNLTGNPSVVLPNGFTPGNKPTSISLTGKLYGEADMLCLAKGLQEATGFHEVRPPKFAV